jgi:hypothetical protein
MGVEDARERENLAWFDVSLIPERRLRQDSERATAAVEPGRLHSAQAATEGDAIPASKSDDGSGAVSWAPGTWTVVKTPHGELMAVPDPRLGDTASRPTNRCSVTNGLSGR